MSPHVLVLESRSDPECGHMLQMTRGRDGGTTAYCAMPGAGHTQECYLLTMTKVPALHYGHYMKYCSH